MQIQRILPSALNLAEETKDPELQELIKQIEIHTEEFWKDYVSYHYSG